MVGGSGREGEGEKAGAAELCFNMLAHAFWPFVQGQLGPPPVPISRSLSLLGLVSLPSPRVSEAYPSLCLSLSLSSIPYLRSPRSFRPGVTTVSYCETKLDSRTNCKLYSIFGRSHGAWPRSRYESHTCGDHAVRQRDADVVVTWWSRVSPDPARRSGPGSESRGKIPHRFGVSSESSLSPREPEVRDLSESP